MWVKTCFLGKGLSPSKLSTKALCGDTRKRGNEKPERGREREAFPVLPAPTTSLDPQTTSTELANRLQVELLKKCVHP